MDLVINSFLITVGVGFGVLVLLLLTFLGQVALLAFLDRVDPRGHR